MQLDASLPWLALGLTPGLASRLSARVLRRFESPDGVFRASLPDLESCRLPAQVAQAIVKKEAFKRAEKARLAMEFGREVFGVPGNVTQPVSFAPNQLIKQGAKLVTCAADVVEELPTPIRAALTQAEAPEAEQRNLLAAASLNSSEKKLYDLLSEDQPVHIDDIVERSGLNSSGVLATLFTLEMKGIVRQLPGKQFCKVLL
jgi:DNA processing protein